MATELTHWDPSTQLVTTADIVAYLDAVMVETNDVRVLQDALGTSPEPPG